MFVLFLVNESPTAPDGVTVLSLDPKADITHIPFTDVWYVESLICVALRGLPFASTEIVKVEIVQLILSENVILLLAKSYNSPKDAFMGVASFDTRSWFAPW